MASPLLLETMMANRFFSLEGEGWAEFPPLSYGRIDQTEPLDISSADEILFAFDVADARWPFFKVGQPFDLDDPRRVHSRMTAYWQQMFRAPPNQRPEDLYEKAPIYRVEITVRKGDRYFDQLIKLSEEEWVAIELASSGTDPVDVYGGLFADPVVAYLVTIYPVPKFAPALSATFDMDTWPDAAETDIKADLQTLPDIDFLVTYDIGQGGANGLLDANEWTRLYFDLGCGVYGNKHTKPTPLRFCWQKNPRIVLSHWDSDHWAGEAGDPAAHGRTWIAPRQSISTSHTTFASKILKAGGTIHIWGSSPQQIKVSAGSRALHFARCTGPRSSRNGSGISCLLDNPSLNEAWLLTGDAGYHQLSLTIPSYVNAIVIPHHGGDMGSKSNSAIPGRPGGYARLCYSFGPGNKHGKTHVQHPTSAAVTEHSNKKWNHGAWTLSSPATVPAGYDVLATASHSGTHQDGAAVAWSKVASVPFTTVPCAPSPTSNHGCTGRISQA